ncbi:MAG: glutamate 5-kinase [Candidatus Altiarchaeota archaeon]
MERRKLLQRSRRIVVKVGTASITEDLNLSDAKVGKIAKEVNELRKTGKEVIIVSSGAIAAGIRKLRLGVRPRLMDMLQATAAVGQNELMKAYGKAFSREGVDVAQILLTRDDFNSRNRCLMIRNTINALIKARVVPIINENDSVAVDEIRFGDNDTLSAVVAANTGADLLVLLSSMDGLYTKDPERSSDAVKIHVVDRITSEISSLQGRSRLGGVGGISAKVKAGKLMMECGIPMAIVDASMDGVFSRLLRGESVGTVFVPDEKVGNRRRWMLFSPVSKGSITVDDGAARIIAKGTASLLPSGITQVKGLFKKGDLVTVTDRSGAELARGISNLQSDEIDSIKGLKSAEASATLGRPCREVICHDNMLLLER